MKAQVIKQFGDPSVFQEMDVEKPKTLPGTVLIKVAASSINPIDCKIRAGRFPEISPAFPAILHGDLAGTVEEVAEDVFKFKKGDQVFGWVGGVKNCPGVLSEYVLADAELIAKMPRSVSFKEASALPLISITAWEALFRKAHIRKNDKILIHGGVGGVGHIAIQLAKWREANVSTTVLKQEDISVALSLKADNVIEAKKEQVSDYVQRLTMGKGFDIVFDTIGGSNIDLSFIASKLNGNVVTTAARSTHDLSILHNKGLSLHAIFTLIPLIYNQDRQEYGNILSYIAKLTDKTKIKPLVDPHYFSFSNISQAHQYLEKGQNHGKVVIIYP
jgi:NADPH:quinone reductase